MPTVTFVTPAGRAISVRVEEGESLLHAALTHDVDGVLGECGGSLACGTCHVYVDERFAPLLPPIEGDEDAMLELASDRRDTSRLCCQLRMTTELDGLVLQVTALQP